MHSITHIPSNANCPRNADPRNETCACPTRAELVSYVNRLEQNTRAAMRLFSSDDAADVLDQVGDALWLSIKAIGRPDGSIGTKVDPRRRFPFIVQWHAEQPQPFMPYTRGNTHTRLEDPHFHESWGAYCAQIGVSGIVLPGNR